MSDRLASDVKTEWKLNTGVRNRLDLLPHMLQENNGIRMSIFILRVNKKNKSQYSLVPNFFISSSQEKETVHSSSLTRGLISIFFHYVTVYLSKKKKNEKKSNCNQITKVSIPLRSLHGDDGPSLITSLEGPLTLMKKRLNHSFAVCSWWMHFFFSSMWAYIWKNWKLVYLIICRKAAEMFYIIHFHM